MAASNVTKSPLAYAPAGAPYLNLGNLDRVFRYALAAMLVGQVFLADGTLGWRIHLTLLSIPLLATAVCGWDPLYHLADISTARPVPTVTESAQRLTVVLKRLGLPAPGFVKNTQSGTSASGHSQAPANRPRYHTDSDKAA